VIYAYYYNIYTPGLLIIYLIMYEELNSDQVKSMRLDTVVQVYELYLKSGD